MYGDNQNYNGQVPPGHPPGHAPPGHPPGHPPGPPGSDNMNPFMTLPSMPPLLSKYTNRSLTHKWQHKVIV